jgi:UDP-N-acetylmuramoyl-L-alanyl-D-glutamate--2,6-diaminopimelate ligase
LYYDNPSAEMQVVGITGTNGKTTTAHLIASIFEAAGIRCGVLGTVGHRIGADVREATHTTPEAPDVQALLREMVHHRCGALRDGGVVARADAAPGGRHHVRGRRVTNLTRDHLDFHGDMESYFQASAGCSSCCPVALRASSTSTTRRGRRSRKPSPRPVTYAVNRPADITSGPLSFSLEGLSFDVRTPRGTLHVRSSLVGRPNVYNILAAVATGTALGLSFDAIERGVQTLPGVPGRFQLVSEPRDEFTVVVDYAHTDDALRNLLETARPLARGRLITVFGCGGDRDRTKRPLMGAVAGTPERPHRHHVRQPARRGPAADHRRDSTRPHGRIRVVTARSRC